MKPNHKMKTTDTLQDEADQTAILDPKPAHTPEATVNRGMAFACILIRDGLPLNHYEASFVAERFNAVVPAPNSHDALVKACQYARGVLLECGSEGEFTHANALQIIDRMTAALAAAKGQL